MYKIHCTHLYHRWMTIIECMNGISNEFVDLEGVGAGVRVWGWDI